MNEAKTEICEMAEQVFEKPLSGAFEEVLFGSDLGNTLWVKFSDKHGINEWIGKFGVGGIGAGRVIKFAEPDKFIIAAGCYAYLVDATSRKLLNQYKDPNTLDVIFDENRKTFIAADYTHLHWVEFGGKRLYSRQVSVDGISDLKIENGVLSGLAYKDYGGREQRFWFDLNTLKLLRWEKPWWKFW